MSEFLARFGTDDEALLRRVLGVGAAGPTRSAPDRIVVDAHVPSRAPALSVMARRAGRAFLIDPQTYYLQDLQHPQFPWTSTPFGRPEPVTPADLTSTKALDALVIACVEYQLAHDATAVIPPYVHIEKIGDGWSDVQAALWARTARYLHEQCIGLPVIAVVALGWTTLAPQLREQCLSKLAASLRALRPVEIALAASKIDQGVRPADRLAELVLTIRHLRRIAPVIAWQQGVLGEAAVAAGAIGYECGIGWRERCDLQSAMRQHRAAPAPDGRFAARPVYVPQLGRSLPKATVVQLMSNRGIAPDLICMDPQCCPRGGQSLLGDAREHALASRRRQLAEVAQSDQPAWQWRVLADRADAALALAARVNFYVKSLPAEPRIARVDIGALTAMQVVANNRRQTLRRRRAA